MERLKIKKLKEEAQLPQRATSGSAGYDLFACLEEPVTILPGEVVKVGTGIALEIEEKNCGAFLFARSGLASKFLIAPANCVGVVDSDYRGEVIIPLFNCSQRAFVVRPGERIAQMVLLPVLLPELEETDMLEDTQRGAGGFGSTGTGSLEEMKS